MKTNIIDRACLAISVLCLGFTLPLGAATIYNNSTNDLLLQFEPGTNQVGNEIILAGTDRFLTDFSFEYWGANSLHPGTFSGTIEAEVQFYLNDGTPFHGYATPGTSIFNSGWFGVTMPAAGRATEVFGSADFGPYGLFLPVYSNMTWSVQFRGMGSGDSVGVDLYGPPTVGQAYGDYWQFSGSSWALMTNSAAPPFANFAADMVATVPEPSSVALSILGGLGLMIAVRRFRRKE